jgi:hypothetical protein
VVSNQGCSRVWELHTAWQGRANRQALRRRVQQLKLKLLLLQEQQRVAALLSRLRLCQR